MATEAAKFMISGCGVDADFILESEQDIDIAQAILHKLRLAFCGGALCMDNDPVKKDYKVLIDIILRYVCEEFEMTEEQLHERSRRWQILRPRQVFMWLCKKYTNITLLRLGKIFGQDHTTAINGVNHIQQLMDDGNIIKDQVLRIEKRIRTLNL